jgi:hypothetical protein
MDCRIRLSLSKSGMVGKSKNRKRAAEYIKNFSQLQRLLVTVNRNTALQRKGMEIAIFFPIAAWKFSLLSYWLVTGIWAFPSGFPIPFRNFPGYTLLAVLRGCPTAFKSISKRLSAKMWQFPSLFSKGLRFC